MLLRNAGDQLPVYMVTSNKIKVKAKGKVHPRTGHEGPEEEQRYSSTLSLTLALDECGWSTPRPGRFTPGKDPVPIVYEAGWASRPVWTGAENLATTGIRSPNRPARSASLYRKRNPGPRHTTRPKFKFSPSCRTSSIL